MKVSEYMREAKSLIANPENWCQGFFAMNVRKQPTSATSADACKWCSIGALLKVNSSSKLYSAAYQYLDDAIEGFAGIEFMNDIKPHAEVMAIWDKAIALAEADGR